MEQLCEAFENAMAEGQIDPLILIPMFILDFLCIHPFNDGNGRMSRLLTLLMLYKAGYIAGKYVSIEKMIELINQEKQMVFYFGTEEDTQENKIIQEKITSMSVYLPNTKKAYYFSFIEENNIQWFKNILEDKEIKKIGINLTKSYILLKQRDITLSGIYYDISIAGYILNIILLYLYSFSNKSSKKISLLTSLSFSSSFKVEIELL